MDCRTIPHVLSVALIACGLGAAVPANAALPTRRVNVTNRAILVVQPAHRRRQ